jgi:hypothetical protein
VIIVEFIEARIAKGLGDAEVFACWTADPAETGGQP